jgi:hypothetical protein
MPRSETESMKPGDQAPPGTPGSSDNLLNAGAPERSTVNRVRIAVVRERSSKDRRRLGRRFAPAEASAPESGSRGVRNRRRPMGSHSLRLLDYIRPQPFGHLRV